MPLYLTIELISLSVPLLLSFDKKVAFHKQWKVLFPALICSSLLFIAADIVFTERGIWGFNAKYHSGILAGGIPLEEWLFFLIIPYASIFTHYVLVSYFPMARLPRRQTVILAMSLFLLLIMLAIFFDEKAYTMFYSAVMAVLLIITLVLKAEVLSTFFFTFLVILIPFFIVNGILTGTFIEEEVVWYNNSEITGLRLGTVPVEDILYGFSLILLNLLLMDLFGRTYRRKDERSYGTGN